MTGNVGCQKLQQRTPNELLWFTAYVFSLPSRHRQKPKTPDDTLGMDFQKFDNKIHREGAIIIGHLHVLVFFGVLDRGKVFLHDWRQSLAIVVNNLIKCPGNNRSEFVASASLQLEKDGTL